MMRKPTAIRHLSQQKHDLEGLSVFSKCDLSGYPGNQTILPHLPVTWSQIYQLQPEDMYIYVTYKYVCTDSQA